MMGRSFFLVALLMSTVLLMGIIPASASLNAPTTYDTGFKIWGKYIDGMGEAAWVNGTGNMAPYDYLIRPSRRQNTFVIAVNGSTGAIDYTGTNNATVVSNALSALPFGTWRSKVVFFGNLTLDNSASPISFPPSIVVENHGSLAPTDPTKTFLSFSKNTLLVGGTIDCGSSTHVVADTNIQCVFFNNSENIEVSDTNITNAYSRGLFIGRPRNAILESVSVNNSYRNIMLWGPGDGSSGGLNMNNIHSSYAVENAIDMGTFIGANMNNIWVNESPNGIIPDSVSNVNLNNYWYTTSHTATTVAFKLIANTYGGTTYNATGWNVNNFNAERGHVEVVPSGDGSSIEVSFNQLHINGSTSNGLWLRQLENNSDIKVTVTNAVITNSEVDGISVQWGTGNNGTISQFWIDKTELAYNAQKGMRLNTGNISGVKIGMFYNSHNNGQADLFRGMAAGVDLGNQTTAPTAPSFGSRYQNWTSKADCFWNSTTWRDPSGNTDVC